MWGSFDYSLGRFVWSDVDVWDIQTVSIWSAGRFDWDWILTCRGVLTSWQVNYYDKGRIIFGAHMADSIIWQRQSNISGMQEDWLRDLFMVILLGHLPGMRISSGQLAVRFDRGRMTFVAHKGDYLRCAAGILSWNGIPVPSELGSHQVLTCTWAHFPPSGFHK